MAGKLVAVNTASQRLALRLACPPNLVPASVFRLKRIELSQKSPACFGIRPASWISTEAALPRILFSTFSWMRGSQKAESASRRQEGCEAWSCEISHCKQLDEVVTRCPEEGRCRARKSGGCVAPSSFCLQSTQTMQKLSN